MSKKNRKAARAADLAAAGYATVPQEQHEHLPTLKRLDVESYEDWLAGLKASLGPCPECGSPYKLDDPGDEVGLDDEGEVEAVWFLCSTIWEDGDDGQHPETHGVVTFERCIARY